MICLYFISCARKSKRPGFVRLVCFGEKKSVKTTNDFPEGIWYNTSILAGVYQSTLMVPCGQKKEDKTSPGDSRCGIVETCRNASAKPGGRENAHCGGSAVRVGNTMAEVKLVNVKKIYPFVSGEEKKSKKKKKGEEPAEEKKVNLQITDKGVVAVQEFNLDIADKEFIVLVGPSGCGKSTTLRMVAGLEEISEGELYIDGKLMNDVAPKDRDIAMVFQNYALYPHMTVYDNMAFSLKLKKTPKAEIDRKVREAAEILDITQYLNRKPKALSGGQRQRVAIGRAIVRNPKVFLMDEPLSNLDAKLRNQMRAEIIKLREKIDTTFIYVTHDQVEAMTLGDRIVIMRDGFIQQIGTPQEVFNHPANLFVAGFIGTPQMNFFDATLAKKGDKYVATVQGKDFELPADKQEALKKMDKVPVDIIAGVRPVHIHLSQDGIDAMVDVSELMGSELHLHVNSNGKDVVIVVPTTDIDLDAVHGSHKPVKYSFKPELMHFFDKETEKNIF